MAHYSFQNILVPSLHAFSQISKCWCVLGEQGQPCHDWNWVPLCRVLHTPPRGAYFTSRKKEVSCHQIIWPIVLHSAEWGWSPILRRSPSSGSHHTCPNLCSRLTTCLSSLFCVRNIVTLSGNYYLCNREERWLAYVSPLNRVDTRWHGQKRT